MYESIRYKRPRGACVFELNESLQDAKITLRLAGIDLIRVRKLRSLSDYTPTSRAFRELEDELIGEGEYEVYEGFGFYDDTPLTLRFYCDYETRKVRYLAILAYRPRVMRRLRRKLEELGWRRRFLFEIEARVRRPT